MYGRHRVSLSLSLSLSPYALVVFALLFFMCAFWCEEGRTATPQIAHRFMLAYELILFSLSHLNIIVNEEKETPLMLVYVRASVCSTLYMFFIHTACLY
jgi:hypothetical protein